MHFKLPARGQRKYFSLLYCRLQFLVRIHLTIDVVFCFRAAKSRIYTDHIYRNIILFSVASPAIYHFVFPGLTSALVGLQLIY